MKKISRVLFVLSIVLSVGISLSACGFLFLPTPTPQVEIKYITFDTNGGSEIEPFEFEKNSIHQLYDVADPEKYGYTFYGWYIDEEITVKFSSNSHYYLFEDNFTLYAKWEPSYKVTFELNGGDGDEFIYVQKDFESQNYTCFGELPEPQKEGYAFRGWFFESELSEQVEPGHTLTEDKTLYAKWGKKYTATFNSNGGSAVEPFEIVEGDEILGDAFDIPTKDNYVFDDWFANEELNSRPDIVTGDIHFYAKWVNALTLSFDTNGGTEMSPITVGEGHYIKYFESNSTKGGYKLYGWYLNEGLTEKFDGVTMQNDLTLFAKWINKDAIILTAQNFLTYFSFVEEECEFNGETPIGGVPGLTYKNYTYKYKIVLKSEYSVTEDSSEKLNIDIKILLYDNRVSGQTGEQKLTLQLDREDGFSMETVKGENFTNLFEQDYWNSSIQAVDGYIVLAN